VRSFCSLTKTFRGEEWLPAMILALYPHCEKLVFVNSEVSWTGGKGNTCKPVIAEMMRTMDSERKIVSLDFDTTSQLDQCERGYQWIKENLHCDFTLLADSDEIFDESDILRAKAYIEKYPTHMAYRNKMYTYVKHPLYRLDPIESLHPVTFVNTEMPTLGKNFRSCDLPYVTMEDVYLHHYVHVRKDFNTVLEKIITSHVSEGDAYQDMSDWIPNVWNKLPEIEGHWRQGWHPNVRFKGNWTGIRKIGVDEMPAVFRHNDFPILEQFGIRRASGN
jgi:hypothetical protein